MCVGFVNASSCNHVVGCEQNTADTDFKTAWQQTQNYRKGRSMTMSRYEVYEVGIGEIGSVLSRYRQAGMYFTLGSMDSRSR